MGLNVMMMSGKPIVKEQLRQVHTLKDINPGYPASWISEYLEVEISLIAHDDTQKSVIGPSDILNDEQLDLIQSAQVGTDIKVGVKYRQKDAMKDHTTKSMIFTYTVVPDNEAKYNGGHDAMVAYLQESASAQKSLEALKEVELLVVKFTIDETGKTTDVIVSQSTAAKDVDNTIVNVMETMPEWNPASNADGTKVAQTFELNIGRMIGC